MITKTIFMKKQIATLLVGLCVLVSATAQKKLPLTLESIWGGYFDEKNLQPHILNTRPAVAFIRAEKETNFEGILTLDMVSGKIIDTIFTNQTKVEGGGTPITFAFFEDFEFAPDDSKILIKTERQNIYHTSFKEFIYLWNDEKKILKPVSTDGKISCASFNTKGNYLAYIREANLYFKNLENDKITPVTTDGAYGTIINGMADEVYEDGFGMNKMYEWSPDGEKIAFVKINQAFVKKLPLITFEKNEPVIKQQVFAKPGEAISEVGIFVYDIKNNSFSKLELGSNANQYITGFKWQPNGETIFVERLSRSQKKLDIVQCNAINGNFIKTVFSEEKPDYVRVNNNNMVMHPEKPNFYWLTEKDGYNHIYDINYEKNITKAVTKSNYEIKSIDGYNTKDDMLYFTSNIVDASQNHLYSINGNGEKLKRITNADGWHTTWLSKDYKYFFDKNTTINTPSVYRIFRTNGREITNKALIENRKFAENIKPYDVNKANYFKFQNKKGVELNGWVITGDKLDNIKKKPLLLYVYGGNNRQEVTDEWNDRMAMTFRYFANKGYTVACIDPSGTMGKGEKFRKLTYNNIADVAIEDILETKQYLLRNYSIDEDKTALMGWSYGGFLTSLAATKYGGSFNKYIAIAPVTNWRDYGAAFTERILQMPSDNPETYKTLNPEEYLNNYKGGLLLIHGSADDNVHVQHSMKLAKALTDTDAYYDIQIFTDKGHNLSDGTTDKTRMNLFRKIYKFLERNEIPQ
jgi:dipeptidyl-peptidase 4